MIKKVAIIQGSKSDDNLGDNCAEVLSKYNISFDRFIISAHSVRKYYQNIIFLSIDLLSPHIEIPRNWHNFVNLQEMDTE
jgi:hypothetical protein